LFIDIGEPCCPAQIVSAIPALIVTHFEQINDADDDDDDDDDEQEVWKFYYRLEIRTIGSRSDINTNRCIDIILTKQMAYAEKQNASLLRPCSLSVQVYLWVTRVPASSCPEIRLLFTLKFAWCVIYFHTKLTLSRLSDIAI